jgi:hypothetical protein
MTGGGAEADLHKHAQYGNGDRTSSGAPGANFRPCDSQKQTSSRFYVSHLDKLSCPIGLILCSHRLAYDNCHLRIWPDSSYFYLAKANQYDGVTY